MRRLLTLLLIAPTVAFGRGPSARNEVTLNFDTGKPGASPTGFITTLTGKGRPGQWSVLRDPTAPSGDKVLAQLDPDDTDYRFPLCVYAGFAAADVELSVKLKPVSGQVDQAAGLVWRYQDADNYYVVRANALEGNAVLYKVQKGKRIDLKPKGSSRLAYGKKVKVPGRAWSELKVAARGRLFTVHLNGKKLFEVEDDTFQNPGKIGLWTKADSVVHFDDLKALRLDQH